jgi:hypothetical protein
MTREKRTAASVSEKSNIGAGPYLARIVGHGDPTFMGSLEVTLMRDEGNTNADDNQTYVVRCASPFYGYTAYEYMGQNTTVGNPNTSTLDVYNDTQKSYGMWMVPPDVGVNVLVFFANGDPSLGYWLGCVPGRFINNMVPALAGSTEVDYDSTDKKKYNTGQPLPVAEINKKINATDLKQDPETIKKALHPFAEWILAQGLIEDDVRGVTTSSARREAPSMVFGISTPGPLDRRNGSKRAYKGKIEDKTKRPVPISRLGGTQFVMDDGDDRYVRATPANVGPVKYIDVINSVDTNTGLKTNEKGDPTIPYNEYFRIRTRTGHQLLMHNSEDIIYIGNSRGTTWIELTSNGKIDIFAEDSVSIHTKNDLNIKADRDINMEAGRNFNVRTESGRMQMDIATEWKVTVGVDGKITVGGDYEHVVGGSTKITTSSAFDLNSGTSNKFTAGTTTDIRSGGNHTETAARIDMNGPVAKSAVKAVAINPLNLHENPNTSTTTDWATNKFQDGTVSSIMKRVPMHEPWILHENQAPQLLTPANTDREA